MSEMNSHPAVFAGLLGSAAWGIPTLAFASPLDDVAEAVANSLVLQFVVGCAAGAVVAGAIAYTVEHVSARRQAKGDVEDVESADELLDDNRWSSSSLNLMRAAEDEIDDDPTGDLGRYRTGQFTIDIPVVAETPVIPEASDAPAANKPRHFRRPRHAAAVAAVRMVPQTPSTSSGRHFAGSEQAERVTISIQSAPEVASAPAATSKGRHFATPVAMEQKNPAPHVPAIRTAAVEASVADLSNGAVLPLSFQGSSKDQLRARLASLPSIDSRYAKTPRPVVAVSSQKPVDAVVPMVKAVPAQAEKQANETSIETNVTGRLRFRDRVAARTKSVREVLADRLGSNPLEGVPMIQRADGSTVEVKPTWFDHTVAPALAGITGSFAPLEDTASRNASTLEAQVAVTSQGESSRASYISRHVAEVNVGMFPERRSADELEKHDIWEEALAAMGDSIMQENPVIFQDVVGGPSSIDDPDGLEGPTGVVPFRVPSSHPEVVDTKTYVDYLVRDELSHSGFEVLRSSPHAHLRVIEGGTGNLHMRKRMGDTGPSSRTGRHFAAASLAKEA